MKPETLKVLLKVLHDTFGPVGREGFHPLHLVVQAEIGETPDGLWGPRTEDGARKLSRRCSGTHPTLEHSTAVLTAVLTGKQSTRRKISFGEAVTLLEEGKTVVCGTITGDLFYRISDGKLYCHEDSKSWRVSYTATSEHLAADWFITEEPCT
jgi:hypothetical protein